MLTKLADPAHKIVHMLAVGNTGSVAAVCDPDMRQLVKNVCAIELAVSDLGIDLNEDDLGQAIDWTKIVDIQGRVNDVNNDAPGMPEIKYPNNGCALKWGPIKTNNLTTKCPTQGKLLVFLAGQYSP